MHAELSRRAFLGGAIGAAATGRWAFAADAPRDIRITRVVSFELESVRPKHIGKNAYRHDHGSLAYDRIVRFYTNAGIDGFGPCWAGANECAAVLGRSPFEFFDADAKRVAGPMARYTTPLWDLAGRILKKPVYELLGGRGHDRVPVYDGAFYFTDLRPMFRQNWAEEFGREVERSLAMGHRAMKIKVGRGKLWMRADEGLRRDVEVVRLFRRLAGNEVFLAADANDGYDPEQTRRFLAETADCRLGMIEEPFPESVDEYVRLKKFLREQKLEMRIGDGENIRRPAEMKAWVDAKAVDVLQGDMNLFGFEDILAEASMAAVGGASVAPHNWGSLLGYYLQLHVGRAIPNFFMAEQDPLSCKAVLAEGYEIKDGRSSVPAAPGLGLQLDEAALSDVACVHFDLKA